MAGMVKIYQKDNVLFSGMPITFVNLVRRICVTQIPIYAIDKVEVYENQSLLIDEMLVHRLAMIPFSVPEYRKTGIEKKYGVKFKIKAKEDGYVTIRDMFLENKDVEINLPKKQDIIVTLLQKDCMIWLEAELVLGTMKEHAKWSSCWAYLNHFNHSFEMEHFDYCEKDDNLNELTEKAFNHYKSLVDKTHCFAKLKHDSSTVYPHTILFIESHCDYTAIEIYKLACLHLLEMKELPN